MTDNLESKKNASLKKQAPVWISFTLPVSEIPRFYPILQQGFMLKVRVGCPIKNLLCDQLGMDPAYVEKSIKTVFYDGKPVDDIDKAIIKDGTTLALSAAMPGLVGATFRRGGHLAPFRSQITHREAGGVVPEGEGVVQLKLFNLLVRELGSKFLERGILVRWQNLKDFLDHQGAYFWKACKIDSAGANGINFDNLLKKTTLEDHELVLLVVHP